METKLTLKQMTLIASLMISGGLNAVQTMDQIETVGSNIEAPITPFKANRFVAVTAGLGSIVAAGTPAAVAVITDGGKAVTNVVASKAVTNAVAPRSFGLFKNPFMATSTNKVVVPETFGLFKNPFVKSVDNIVVAPVATSSNAVSTFANIVNKGCELGQATLGAMKNAGNAGFAIVKNHPKTAIAVAVGTVALGYAYKYYKYSNANRKEVTFSEQPTIIANTATNVNSSAQVAKSRTEFLKDLKHGFEECYKTDMDLLLLIKDGKAQVTNETKSAFESIKISDYLGSTDPLAKDLELKRYRMGIWFNSVAKNVTKINSLYAESWKLFLKVLDSAILAEEAKATIA